jgi:hypothetical protein
LGRTTTITRVEVYSQIVTTTTRVGVFSQAVTTTTRVGVCFLATTTTRVVVCSQVETTTMEITIIQMVEDSTPTSTTNTCLLDMVCSRLKPLLEQELPVEDYSALATTIATRLLSSASLTTRESVSVVDCQDTVQAPCTTGTL